MELLKFLRKGLEKYTEKMPENISIEKLQNISLLGSAHILRKVQVSIAYKKDPKRKRLLTNRVYLTINAKY